MRLVTDSDTVRRQNRGLVFSALRTAGPLTRTQLAAETGLSNASITAITQDMLGQALLTDVPDEPSAELRLRGRPAVRIGLNRHAAALALIEIDVNRARFSLVDYGGTLIDRIETNLIPGFFIQTAPLGFIEERLATLGQRNPLEFAMLRRIAISVQGILDREGDGLTWSPVAGLAGHDIAPPLTERFGVPVVLNKRGRLLAEGTRWLDPDLRDARLITIFVGSTVAMGMSASGPVLGRGEDGATEFGHMNHVPNGALCRCGTRGCIEAYAADYGVLRTAYSVPEHTAPAAQVPAAAYEDLIRRAQQGDRTATQAFNLAGRAIGYGIARLLAVSDPSHVIIVGPGARALGLMRPEIDAALAASFVCRVNGTPEVRALRDESEPIFMGLMMEALVDLDQTDFAPLAAVSARA
ncbi:MAG TPA: ROK family protein [Devosia sp.]|nr:ROK family protein [Devosia sp.]